MNGLLYCLQDSVGAYGFEMEDYNLKMLHEISDGLRPSHQDLEKTDDSLFPPD